MDNDNVNIQTQYDGDGTRDVAAAATESMALPKNTPECLEITKSPVIINPICRLVT